MGGCILGGLSRVFWFLKVVLGRFLILGMGMKPNVYLYGEKGIEFRIQLGLPSGSNFLVVSPALSKEGWRGKILGGEQLEVQGHGLKNSG